MPETTNNIQTGIKNFLNSKGHKAFRVNTTGLYDKDRNLFRRIAEDDKGVGDVLACINGRFVCFEVKFEGDKQSDAQLKFQSDIINAGGIYKIIRKYAEFAVWYELNIVDGKP